MFRAYAIWPFLGLLVFLATGCGTSEAASASGGTPVAKRRAVAYARAVNLRSKDVPGLVVNGASHTAIGPFSTQAKACGIAVPAGTVARSPSPTFQRLGEHTNASRVYNQSIASVVDVTRSAAQASQEIAAINAAAHNPTIVTCLKHDIENTRVEEEHESGATVQKPTEEPPIFSDAEVSARRVSAGPIQANGLQIKAHSAFEAPTAKGFNFYENWLGYAVGPTVIVLIDAGTPRSLPATTERRLLALMYRRAKTHSL